MAVPMKMTAISNKRQTELLQRNIIINKTVTKKYFFSPSLTLKMSDNKKSTSASFITSRKSKRQSEVTVPPSSSASNIKTKSSGTNFENVSGKKVSNTTFFDAEDTTKLQQELQSEYRQVAYGKCLRAMLEECLIDEKIEREQAIMDLQMTALAERFMKTNDQLVKTNKRMKDLSLSVEKMRLLDHKTQINAQFFETTNKSNAETILRDLNSTGQAYLDKIHLKDVDFGYNHTSGHKQLLDAVNDATEGLEQIKKSSNLDLNKFKAYEKSQSTIEELVKDRLDLESLKSEFEENLPELNEQVMKKASDVMAEIIKNDDNV